MQGKLLFLGTGASVGVPMIGCPCAVCHSPSPFNHRLRPSALIEIGNKRFLIDVGPDFRQQALQYGIDYLDGVLLTHAHYDHTAGLDDLRPLCFRRKYPLPFLLSQATAEEIERRYDYLFHTTAYPQDNGLPRFNLHRLTEERGEVEFEGINWQYVSYWQGGMLVKGFRVGQLAYLTDIYDFPHTLFDDLQGVEILVISALRHDKSPIHFSIEEAVTFAQQLQARETWLIHLSHNLEYEATNALLPPNVRLAYDGLTLTFGA